VSPRTALLMVGLCAPLCAQTAVPNRATQLVFASDVTDARAVWLNPAGLSRPLFASVAADVTILSPFESGAEAVQWSGAASSRGLGFGYQHDRLQPEGVRDTYRVGYGRAARRTAIGLGVTFHHGVGGGTGGDVGLIYLVAPSLRVAADLSNIGRPNVGGAPLPLSLQADATWLPASALSLSAGMVATEDRFEQWAAGATLRLGGRLPIALLARVDVPQETDEMRVSLGLTLGTRDAVQVGATAPKSFGQIDLLNVSGVSTRVVGR